MSSTSSKPARRAATADVSQRRRASSPERAAADREYLVRLGQRLRLMRKAHGIGRRDLASMSRISERYLAQIESGKGNVSVLLLRHISQAIRANRRIPVRPRPPYVNLDD